MKRPLTPDIAIKSDPANANRGTERGHSIIRQSLTRHGAGRPGLAARDGTMIAGNQTLSEVEAAGFTIKPVPIAPNEWIVAVREDVEPGSEQAVLMALEDNQASYTGYNPDPAVLAGIADTQDLSRLFTAKELERWLAALPPAFEGADSDTENGAVGVNHGSSFGSGGGFALPEALPPSYVRMVQLFFTGETQPEFLRLCQALMPHFGKDNVTDTVFEAVRYAYRTLGLSDAA